MIEKIKNSPRYHFPVQYIFRNSNWYSVSAFLKPNFSTGFHVQYFYEVVLITRGDGYHFIGNETIQTKKGDLFVIPPGVRHAFKSEHNLDVYHFHFSPAFFDKYFPIFNTFPSFSQLFEAHTIPGNLISSPDYRYRKMVFLDKEYELLLAAFEDLNAFWKNYSVHIDFLAETRASNIIHLLCRKYSESEDFISGKSEDDVFISSVKYLKENYKVIPQLSELSEMAKMSKTAYTKKFKRTFGVSAHRFAMNERIKKAKELLLQTDDAVNEIADKVGFYDISHFEKYFTRAEGCTPNQYRNEERQKKNPEAPR